MVRVCLVSLLALAAACVKPAPYQCASSDDCGPGDVCVPAPGGGMQCAGGGGDGGDGGGDRPDAAGFAQECVPGSAIDRAATSCPAVCDRMPSCCAASWTRLCVQLAETECHLGCSRRVAFASTGAVDVHDIAADGAGVVLTALPRFGTAGGRYRSVAWVDFERDHQAELLVSTADSDTTGDEMWVLRPGDPWQTVADLGALRDGYNGFEIGAGDYDGDGRIDVLATGIYPSLLLLRNVGPGEFVIGADPPAAIDAYLGASFDRGDLDDDGRDDLVVIDYYTGRGRIVRWNDDRFEAGGELGPYDAPRRVTLGDVDGDHDLDLAVADGDYVRVLRTSAGAFEPTELWAFTVEHGDFTDAAWIDVDGDHDLDLAVVEAPFGGGPLRLFENIGGDLTDQPRWQSVGREVAQKLAVGDVDGDGDLDLAIANEEGPDRIYLNDGDWTFSVGWTAPDAQPSFGVALGPQ